MIAAVASAIRSSISSISGLNERLGNLTRMWHFRSGFSEAAARRASLVTMRYSLKATIATCARALEGVCEGRCGCTKALISWQC